MSVSADCAMHPPGGTIHIEVFESDAFPDELQANFAQVYPMVLAFLLLC
jgi:hypothetical protein